VDRIFGWYFAGDTELPFPGSDFKFMLSSASANLLRSTFGQTGAMVTGRNNFNQAQAWNGQPPLGVHHFVVTHSVPQEWVKPGSPFTFVTDGVASAIEQAQRLAGDKDVTISSPSIMRQALAAGMLDEINIDLVAILLGDGIRLFEPPGLPANLDITRVVPGTGVTHLQYRVIK
jgi:dihydrofolate reductase